MTLQRLQLRSDIREGDSNEVQCDIREVYE